VADDTANAETYSQAHDVSGQGDRQTVFVASIRHHDTFVTTDGRWPFAEWKLYVDQIDTRALSAPPA
jgi:hypothetical protein